MSFFSAPGMRTVINRVPLVQRLLNTKGGLRISITNVQLDLGAGRRGTDMGPSAMHVAGVVPKLRALGHDITDVTSINVQGNPFEMNDFGDPKARFLPQVADVCHRLADRVEGALEEGTFPLVLGGDHAQAIGTVAGLSRFLRRRGKRLGVIWVDAHTDMNNPSSSPSGNIHGMPVSVLLGIGPKVLTDINGSEPSLRPRDIAIIGARDIDATEAPIVRDLGVRTYTMSELDERGTSVCVHEAFDYIHEATDVTHVSWDMDGVDPQAAPGVGTPVPGGLTVRESHLICEVASRSGRLCGLEVVELNPTLDVNNQTAELATWLIQSAMGMTIL